MRILRRLGSTKVGGSLSCPRCGNTAVKYVETVGFDTDIYICKRCNTRIRYLTIPFTGNVDLRDLKQRPDLLLGKKNMVKLPPWINKFKIRKVPINKGG